MASAELDEASLQGLFHELTFIMTDALDPAGRLAMAIDQSQTETRPPPRITRGGELILHPADLASVHLHVHWGSSVDERAIAHPI